MTSERRNKYINVDMHIVGKTMTKHGNVTYARVSRAGMFHAWRA